MSEKAKIWLPFYVGDYLADTLHLTTEEHGAYLLIFCHQWRRGHMAEDELRQITGLSPDAWSIAQARLKQLLSIDEHGRFFSARLDREKAKWGEKQTNAHEKAKKAANARWQKVRESKAKENQDGNKNGATSIPLANPEQCPSPSSSPGETTTPPSASLRGVGGADPGTAAPAVEQGEEMENKGENARNGATRPSHPQKATEPSPAASQARHGRQPDTLHEVVKRSGTGKKAPAGDSRFSEFKDHLKRFYAAATGEPAEKIPWSIADDRALVSLLRAEPKLSSQELAVRLGHRLDAIRICLEHPRKGNINARDPIAVVIGSRFPLYTDGPVDAFGSPI